MKSINPKETTVTYIEKKTKTYSDNMLISVTRDKSARNYEYRVAAEAELIRRGYIWKGNRLAAK